MANITTNKTDRRLVMANLGVTDFDEFNRLLALAGISVDTKDFTPDQEAVLQQVKNNEPTQQTVGEYRPPTTGLGGIKSLEETIDDRLNADDDYLQGLLEHYRRERRTQMQDFVGKIVEVDRKILEEFTGEGFMRQYHAIDTTTTNMNLLLSDQ